MNPETKKWTIGVILALLAIVVPIVWTTYSAPSKSLAFQILAESNIGTMPTSTFTGVKISIDGVLLDDVTIYTMKLINNNNIPIQHNDFESPICISFGSRAKLFKVTVTEENASEY